MDIAIVGDGVGAGYLYRLLTYGGFGPVDVYGPQKPPNGKKHGCGIASCAWGTLGPEITRLLDNVYLDADLYITNTAKSIHMDINPPLLKRRVQFDAKAKFTTIDKPGMIRDLFEGASIDYNGLGPTRTQQGLYLTANTSTDETYAKYYEKHIPEKVTQYDLVVDATGVDRALLPPAVDDLVVPTSQIRIESGETTPSIIAGGPDFFGGYTWVFPIGDGTAHIGGGGISYETAGSSDRLIARGKGTVRCGCVGRIRTSGPAGALPFYDIVGSTMIVGVGESIGCVSPLLGEGITPAMVSAKLLFDTLCKTVPDMQVNRQHVTSTYRNLGDRYSRAITRRFTYMIRERESLNYLVDCVKHGSAPRSRVRDLITLYRSGHGKVVFGPVNTAKILLSAIL